MNVPSFGELTIEDGALMIMDRSSGSERVHLVTVLRDRAVKSSWADRRWCDSSIATSDRAWRPASTDRDARAVEVAADDERGCAMIRLVIAISLAAGGSSSVPEEQSVLRVVSPFI